MNLLFGVSYQSHKNLQIATVLNKLSFDKEPHMPDHKQEEGFSLVLIFFLFFSTFFFNLIHMQLQILSFIIYEWASFICVLHYYTLNVGPQVVFNRYY